MPPQLALAGLRLREDEALVLFSRSARASPGEGGGLSPAQCGLRTRPTAASAQIPSIIV